MDAKTLGPHQYTYDALFQQPVALNLEWLEVRSMLIAMADTVEQDDDVLRVRRGGNTLVLHRPYSKGLRDLEVLTRVRHFLERSSDPLKQPQARAVDLVVVIDSCRARVYRIKLKGSVPQGMSPYHPAGRARYLEEAQGDLDGDRTPAHRVFYEAVAKTLLGARTILLLGSGVDATTPMRQLLIELGHHHQDLAKRIIGAIMVREVGLSERQMLDKTREFYAPAVHLL